jgi:hypothetical protein
MRFSRGICGCLLLQHDFCSDLWEISGEINMRTNEMHALFDGKTLVELRFLEFR